jgi:hypothetical protein
MKKVSPPRTDSPHALVEAERAQTLAAAMPETTHRPMRAHPAEPEAARSAHFLAALGRHRHPEREAGALAS